jgi:gliding motility-associated-like protein
MAHWYFGDYCSIDFSSGAPVKTNIALNKATIHGEPAYAGQLPYIAATISLSDSSGKLLFYSNGVSVWNGNHKKITSSPIFGISDINASTGMCYIPYPGQPNKYYIVGVYPNFDGKPSGIRYVLVDVAADTVSTYQEFQHPLLPKRFAEHLTIVPHCNGTDYWIIARGNGLDNNTNFYSLQVGSTGIDINQTPVVSTGFSYRTYGGGGPQLKANRSGDKLILSQNLSEAGALYDFDSRTGEVKNEKTIPSIQGYENVQSGVAFSPNGDYFYLVRTSNLTTGGQPYWLFQYRVSDFSYHILPTNGFYFGPPFQLGPDNQLYIVNGANYLARLSNPDIWGGAIFDDKFINFTEPSFSTHVGNSLPAFIDARRKEPIHPDFKIQKFTCQNYLFSALCFDSYTATWDFGDSSLKQTGNTITHTYTKAGEFVITLTLSSGIKTYGSVTKKITILPPSIEITGPDSVCNTSNFGTQYFSKAIPNTNYKWSVSYANISGPDDLTYVDITWPQPALFNGQIQLTVSTADGCFLSATKTVVVTQGPVFTWLLKDSICTTDKPLLLNANPSGGIFSGRGINNGIFSPDSAGTGYQILTYRYGMGSICYSEIQKTIKVINGCSVSVPPVNGGAGATAIPNVFSPNGDGINDTWSIPYLVSYPNAIVDIFNRYGQLVFHSFGYQKNWDGKYNGKDLPIGTYYYRVAVAPNTEPLSGSISIIK